MRHTVEVPDSLWAWFQQRSGKTMPGNEIRDALYEYRINHPDPIETAIDHIKAASQAIDEVQAALPRPFSYRLRALGLLPDPIDHQFTEAFQAFLIAHGGNVDAALTWLEERGFNSPRAWLIDWYKRRESNDSATGKIPQKYLDMGLAGLHPERSTIGGGVIDDA
jgi:hypothetical protein